MKMHQLSKGNGLQDCFSLCCDTLKKKKLIDFVNAKCGSINDFVFSRQTFHRLDRLDKFPDIHIESEGKGDRPSIKILESETTEISFASRHSKHVSVV